MSRLRRTQSRGETVAEQEYKLSNGGWREDLCPLIILPFMGRSMNLELSFSEMKHKKNPPPKTRKRRSDNGALSFCALSDRCFVILHIHFIPSDTTGGCSSLLAAQNKTPEEETRPVWHVCESLLYICSFSVWQVNRRSRCLSQQHHCDGICLLGVALSDILVGERWVGELGCLHQSSVCPECCVRRGRMMYWQCSLLLSHIA